MADTIRTQAQILALFPDNVTRQISAQDLRDFVVSVYNAINTAGSGIDLTALETALGELTNVSAAVTGINDLSEFTELGQFRPTGTSNVTVVHPEASVKRVIDNIVVANTSGSAATFRIMVDTDGAAYSEATAIAWDVELAAGSVATFDGPVILSGSGAVAVRSSVANALTFTFYGRKA